MLRKSNLLELMFPLLSILIVIPGAMTSLNTLRILRCVWQG